MNNNVWVEFINRLYNGFRNTTEVMALIGYHQVAEGVDKVEYIEYYTSHDESEIQGSFRNIVKDMSKYVAIRGVDTRFILVHNHPEGTAEASIPDTQLMQRFKVASAMLGSTFMGSYIYISEGSYVSVADGDLEFNTQQIQVNNLFGRQEGVASVESRRSEAYQNLVENNQMLEEYWGNELNEATIDGVVREKGLTPYLLVELDDSNRLTGIYEIDKLLPNLGDTEQLQRMYHKGLTATFLKDVPRYLVYDKRIRMEKNELGLAEDTQKFIYAMGVCGNSINFYVG